MSKPVYDKPSHNEEEYFARRDAARVFGDAVDQHRNAFAREKEREERNEVRQRACAVVRRDHDGHSAGRERRQVRVARLAGGGESGELFERFAFDAKRDQHAA